MYKLMTLLMLIVLLGCSDNTRKSSEPYNSTNDNFLKEKLSEEYTYKTITEEDQILGFSKLLDTGILGRGRKCEV